MTYKKSFLVCCLLVSALYGCGKDDSESSMGPMGYRGGASSATDVAIAQVKKGEFNKEFTALGTARAKESIDITSRSSNVISDIHFEEGEYVEKGTLLVELDNRELSAEIAIKKAALKDCLLYTSPSPRDATLSRMPSSA